MKLEILWLPGALQYQWRYFDGPDGIIEESGVEPTFEEAINAAVAARMHFVEHYYP
jgi:hypothetical protein